MNTSEKNLDTVLDSYTDDGGTNYPHSPNDRVFNSSNKVMNGSARRKIEEYHEARRLKMLTKGVFED